MSTINTNGLDVNYPIPGVNNSSQGFRDNFTSIKTNLDIAATEISDLENKAVVKSALNNATLNNDMANTLISNAAIRGFRSVTYNLGNALSGTVQINVSQGDVQYGTIVGNTTIQLGGWAPTNTESALVLNLAIANNEAVITFPTQVITSEDYGTTLLENFVQVGNTCTVTAPNGVTQLNYKLTTLDCGNTIYIEPINRSFQATQIKSRTPPLTGQIGDELGTVCIDAETGPVINITSSTSTDFLVTGNTATLFTGMPIIFGGTSFESNIMIGATYYVGNIANTTHFKISPNANAGSNVNLVGSSGNMTLNPVRYMYVAVDNYNASAYAKTIANTTSPNTITLSSTMANIAVNYPVLFAGANAISANLVPDSIYYIKSVSGSNITLSRTIDNGTAGPTFEGITTNASPTFTMVVYDGEDIFRRIPLVPGTTLPNGADIPSTTNIRIGGGVNGYLLSTDGTGNLSWVAGGGSGNGTVGGSNTQIQFNNAGSFGGAAGFTFDNTSNLFSVPGNIAVVGTVNSTDLSISNTATINNISITSNLNVSNVSATGQVVSTGNVFGGNLVTNGVLNVAGNANVGNLGTTGSVIAIVSVVTDAVVAGNTTVTANLDAGNLDIAGIANITGNVFSNSNIISNSYFISSVANAVTATGSDQSTAAALTQGINIVSTVPVSTGVRLPTAVAGMRIIVRNSGANTLAVYPATGAQINALGVNNGYSLPVTTSVELYCSVGGGSGQWFTL